MTESSSSYEGPLSSPKLQHCSQQVRKWQFCILQQIKKFVQVRMQSFVFNRLIARETIALLRQYHFRFKCFFNRANYWFKEAKDKQRFASIVRFCIKNIKNLFVCSLCVCDFVCRAELSKLLPLSIYIKIDILLNIDTSNKIESYK